MFLDGVNIFRMRKVNVDYDGDLFLNLSSCCVPLILGRFTLTTGYRIVKILSIRASDYQHYPQSK